MKSKVVLLIVIVLLVFTPLGVFAEGDNQLTETSVTSSENNQNDLGSEDSSNSESTDVKDSIDSEKDSTVSEIETNNPSNEDVSENKEESENTDSDIPLVDKRNEVYEGSMKLELFLGTSDYIPSGTLVFEDKNGVFARIPLSTSLYNADTNSFSFEVKPKKGYKVGDKFRVYIDSKDPLLKGVGYIEYDDKGNQKENISLVGKKNKIEITATEAEYLNDDETQLIKWVYPNEFQELVLHAVFNTGVTAILVKDLKGNTLRGINFNVHVNDKVKKKLKTDKNGYLLLDNSIAGEEIVLEVLDKGYLFTNDDTFYALGNYNKDVQDGANILQVELKTALDSSKSNIVNITTNIKPSVDSRLSKNWLNGYIEFEGNGHKFTYDIIRGVAPTVSLLEGKYTVKVFSNDAIVSLDKSSITVSKNSKTTLNISFKPKVLFKIYDKDGSYNFAVGDEVFKGKGELVFGVNYGDSILVKDLKRNKFYSVIIEKGSNTTKLVLGEGVVFGGVVSTPNTGDGVVFLVLLLAVSLLGYGVVEMHKRGLLKKVVNLLFVGILVSSGFLGYFENTKVYATEESIIGGATIGSGTPAPTSHGNTTPDGAVQAAHNRSTILMVGFTNGVYKKQNSDGSIVTVSSLDVNSTKEDFENTTVLNPKMLRNVFFMALNQTDYNLFNRPSTSFAVYDKGGLKHIWGTQPFLKDKNTSSYYRSKLGIKCDSSVVSNCNQPSSRLMPLPEDAVKQKNEFVKFVGKVALNLQATNPSTRKVWAGKESSSSVNVGDAISKTYINNLFKDLAQEEGLSEKAYYQKVLDGYIQYLNYNGQDDVAKQIVDDINRKKALLDSGVSDTGINYVFFFQVVPSFYVKGDQSKYMYMPFHDATLWFKDGRVKAGGKGRLYASFKDTHQERTLNGVPSDKGCPSTSRWSWVSPCYSFLSYARGSYGYALKPKSYNVPIQKPTNSQANINVNPFTGWGFVNWWDGRSDVTKVPKLLIKYDITTDDGRNLIIDDPQYKLDGGFDNTLLDILNRKRYRIKRSSTVISHKGEMFRLLDSDMKYYLIDYNYFKDLRGDYNNIPSKYNLIDIDGIKRDQSLFVDKEENVIRFAFRRGGINGSFPSVQDIGKVLGGDSGVFMSSLASRYSGNEFSHALVIVKAKAKSVDTKLKSKLNVPEWAISRYFEDIVDKGVSSSTFEVKFNSSTGINATLTPSGYLSFNPKVADESVLEKEKWLYRTSALYYKDSAERYVGVGSTSHSFSMTGDLLAVRHKEQANPVYLATWMGVRGLFDEAIVSSNKGIRTGSDRVIKRALLKYVSKSPTDSYTYSETRYRSATCYDEDGKPYSCSTPYTHSEPASVVYKDAEYNLEVEYDKHITQVKPASNVVAKKDTKKNAFKEEVYVEDVDLKIYPEVFMMYDGYRAKGTGGAFVIGEVERSIKTPVLNVADYVDTDIKPKVTGMTSATDTKAKQLAQKMGKAGLGVIYKGSAVTVNYETEGKIRLRTYALDIGNPSLKNAWGNSNYNTDKIKEKFLSKFGTKGKNGKWTIEAKASGKLVIDGKEYGGGVKPNIMLNEVDSKVNTYNLVIRGGELYSVNGIVDYMSAPDSLLSKEVKDALTKLKVHGEYGKNIFGSFARNEGDKLTDSDYVRLSKAFRGMTDDVGLNKGWYNEDSTVLVLREYITEFEVPKFAYTDKIPMEIQGLQTPIDKSQYFSTGKFGYVKLTIDLDNDFVLDYNSYDNSPIYGRHEKLYIVPNVSVMDTFGQ